MKKIWLQKALSLTLVAGMTITLSACSGLSSKIGSTDKENGTDNTASGVTRYFRADYLNDLPDAFKNGGGGSSWFSGDKLFYSYYDEEDFSQTICSYDVLTGEIAEYGSFSDGSSGGGVFDETSYLSMYAGTLDGDILLIISSSQIDENTVDKDKYANATKEDLIQYIYENWGMDSYEAAEDYFNSNETDFVPDGSSYGDVLLRYEATEENYIRHTYLAKLDTTGTEVFRTELALDADNGYCNALGSDANGNIYVGMEEWTEESDSSYILVYDTQGNALGKVDTTGSYYSSLVNTTDGRCGYLSWVNDSSGYGITVIDPEKMAVGESVPLGSSYVSNCVALDDHTYIYSSDRGLKEYDTTTEQTTDFLNWMDCNISSSSVGTFGVLSDGRIVVYLTSWESDSYSVDVAVLNEISAEEAGNVKQINVACFYLMNDMENAAIDFNKKHTDYHINITEYYDYSSDVDYQDALDSFVTSVSSDTDIDIVCFDNYSQMLDFAAKGLLIDLNTVLKDDKDLGGDKILPNIINACTFDDKLVALPNYFSVSTLVGKVSDVGTTPGWTVEDLKQLYDTKEPGTQVLAYNTKEDAFNMCISLGYNQFLDLENKTCNFNSQEFIDVLEFVSLFPDEYNMDDDTDVSDLMHDGKVLLYSTDIPNFGQTQMLAAIYGEDVTYIGYPTSTGNGTMMYFSGLSGITKYCEDPDLAWEFLREVYIPNDTDYSGSYFSGSILQSDFDEFFANATNKDNYSGTWGWGNYETEVSAPSQEEVDEVRDIILNSTAVSGAVSTGILNIIKEEASAYFSGQKTAADVAANIQSRMEIYLSETM